MLYVYLGDGIPFWAGYSWVDGTWQRRGRNEWPRGAADGSEFCFSVLGINDEDLDPEDIQILEAAYLRRISLESRIQAVATVEVQMQVLMGSESPDTYGVTKDGKVFKHVTTEAGIARMELP